MKAFEDKAKEIFYLVGEYGIKQKPIQHKSLDKISEQDRIEFITQVHKGFRLGQQKIIEEIIPLFKQRKDLNLKETKVRQEKNKEELRQIFNEQNLIDFKIKILRHFADFIAYLIFKKNYTKLRFLYSGNNKSRPDLLNSNLESVLRLVDNYHKKDDINFALISDLTSFIDIGDLLLLTANGNFIVECKEGKVQEKVFEFIDELLLDDFSPEKIDYTGMNASFFNQVDRTLKQIMKGSKLKEIINTNKGTDPFSQQQIRIIESSFQRENYYKHLIHLIELSKNDNCAHSEIDEMILIGVYREDKVAISQDMFDYLAQQRYSENYIVTDYLSIIDYPLRDSLFFKPFGSNVIFDLIFGRLKIHLALNLDKLIELFNKNGITAKWLTTKETHKILENGTKNKFFMHKKRAIEVITNERQIVLGSAFVVSLLLDNITPNSFVRSYKTIN